MPCLGFFNFKSQMFGSQSFKSFGLIVLMSTRFLYLNQEYVKLYLILVLLNNAETSFDENVL